MEKCIKVDEDAILNDFFDNFFPCVKGHAKIIDDHHSSRNYPCCSTVRNDQIKFYGPERDVPHYLVKIACATIIVIVSEVE